MRAAPRVINSEDGARLWESAGQWLPRRYSQDTSSTGSKLSSLSYTLLQAQKQLVARSQSKHQENPIPVRASIPEKGNGTMNMW